MDRISVTECVHRVGRLAIARHFAQVAFVVIRVLGAHGRDARAALRRGGQRAVVVVRRRHRAALAVDNAGDVAGRVVAVRQRDAAVLERLLKRYEARLPKNDSTSSK